MPDITLRIAAGVLGLVFVWAGSAKLVRWQTWRTGLRRYQLGTWATPAVVVVPILELTVVAGLIGGFSLAASALTLALLAGFCLAVLRARTAAGDRLPCNCFGADSAHDYRTMLVRNGLLGVPAAMILLSGEDFYLFGDARLPSASEAIPVALIGVGLLLGLWMVRVVSTMANGGGGE